MTRRFDVGDLAIATMGHRLTSPDPGDIVLIADRWHDMDGKLSQWLQITVLKDGRNYRWRTCWLETLPETNQ